MLGAVKVGVFVDHTRNWRARFGEQVTRGIVADWQDDAREFIVGDRAWDAAVGFGAVVIACWLAFGHGVCACQQAWEAVIAACVGGGFVDGCTSCVGAC